jgi:heme-degrading monooxygenase HmoA
MPSVIDTDAPVVTLINVFTVTPGRQQELVDALARATREVMVDVPGFVSANLHASLDGTRVANYAQWASAEAFDNMQRRPDVQKHMAEIMAIADGFEPRLFTVSSTHSTR